MDSLYIILGVSVVVVVFDHLPGELGREFIYFWKLGSTSNYFLGAGEQALNFGKLVKW